MKKKKIQILFILSWIFILIALIPSYHGEYTRSIYCDRDSYVCSFYPDWTFFSYRIYVGNTDDGRNQAYYHFDISRYLNFDIGWIDMDIFLDFSFASKPVDLGVGITSNNWSEFNITWNDQPGDVTFIGSYLNDGTPITIPVDENDFTNGEITLILYGRGGDSDGYLVGSSREAHSDFYKPRVSFTFEGLDPVIILWILIAVITISSIVGLTVFLLKRNR